MADLHIKLKLSFYWIQINDRLIIISAEWRKKVNKNIQSLVHSSSNFKTPLLFLRKSAELNFFFKMSEKTSKIWWRQFRTFAGIRWWLKRRFSRFFVDFSWKNDFLSRDMGQKVFSMRFSERTQKNTSDNVVGNSQNINRNIAYSVHVHPYPYMIENNLDHNVECK